MTDNEKRHQTKLWNHFKHITFILFHYKREASQEHQKKQNIAHSYLPQTGP